MRPTTYSKHREGHPWGHFGHYSSMTASDCSTIFPPEGPMALTVQSVDVVSKHGSDETAAGY